MSDVVTPPDQTVWWDATATLTAVLDQLRLTDGDIDQPLLEACIAAAGVLCNNEMDRVNPLDGPPPPAPAQYALQHAAIELYRSRDATAGNPTDFSVAAVITRYGATDPLSNVRALLRPYKQRVGVA